LSLKFFVENDSISQQKNNYSDGPDIGGTKFQIQLKLIKANQNVIDIIITSMTTDYYSIGYVTYGNTDYERNKHDGEDPVIE
jgi:hypothetical protein